MGLFDFIFKNRIDTNKTYERVLNGAIPAFTQFGDDIYASDVVQQVIGCIATEMSKLNPLHVRTQGLDLVPVHSDVARVLKEPNGSMSSSDFIEKIVWSLMLNHNAFILPVYADMTDIYGVTKRRLTELYPIRPSQVDFLRDKEGETSIRFRFPNGYETELKQSNVIHVRYRFSMNEFMGGDRNGHPDNRAILKTLELNDTLLQGVSKALKSSLSLNGVIKYNTLLDDGKMAQNLEKFEKMVRNNDSGFIPVDMKSEVTPFKKDVKLVDSGTLKFIDDKILRNWGVPLVMLTGDYTKSQYEAFYQKTLEPLIKKFQEAFTKSLFTEREKSFGNQIVFYPQELIFLSTDQKIEVIRMLGDSGALYENQKLTAFGFPPLQELEGVRMQSLNYVNTDIATSYQVGGTGVENAE